MHIHRSFTAGVGLAALATSAFAQSAPSADEIAALVTEAIESTGAAELGPKGIGKVMGVVTPQTKGKADGGAVAAEVRKQLAG